MVQGGTLGFVHCSDPLGELPRQFARTRCGGPCRHPSNPTWNALFHRPRTFLRRPSSRMPRIYSNSGRLEREGWGVGGLRLAHAVVPKNRCGPAHEGTSIAIADRTTGPCGAHSSCKTRRPGATRCGNEWGQPEDVARPPTRNGRVSPVSKRRCSPTIEVVPSCPDENRCRTGAITRHRIRGLLRGQRRVPYQDRVPRFLCLGLLCLLWSRLHGTHIAGVAAGQQTVPSTPEMHSSIELPCH